MAAVLNEHPAGEAVSPARCRLCECGLGANDGDDLALRLCGSCKSHPSARRLGLGIQPEAPRRPHVHASLTGQSAASEHARAARDFTPAERALIKSMHRLVPAQQLLDLLNERLRCDLGEDANPYTAGQLAAHVATLGGVAGGGSAPAGDWAGLRRLLMQARRSGLLQRITEQMIDDFAVVFSLAPRQVVMLKDTLLQEQDHA